MRDKTECYFAPVSGDHEPIKWKTIKEINPVSVSSSDEVVIASPFPLEININLDYKQTKEFIWAAILNLKRSEKRLISKNVWKGDNK